LSSTELSIDTSPISSSISHLPSPISHLPSHRLSHRGVYKVLARPKKYEASFPDVRHRLVHKENHEFHNRHTELQARQIEPTTSINPLTGIARVHSTITASLSSIVAPVLQAAAMYGSGTTGIIYSRGTDGYEVSIPRTKAKVQPPRSVRPHFVLLGLRMWLQHLTYWRSHSKADQITALSTPSAQT
jgi:hypothetical protein